MNLKLHINNITLEGLSVPRGQRPQLQAAVAAELSRLFTTHGIPKTVQQSGHIPAISTNLAMTGNPTPTQMGQQVAQSIYTHLQSPHQQSNRATPTHP